MEKYSGTKKFYLISIGSTFLLACLGKILFVLFKTVSADILITSASSFFLRALPYICSFCAELLSRGAFVMAVCSAVYATSFYGKKAGGLSVLSSMICLFTGEALLFLYNIIRNVVGKAGILAWLVSIFFELLFSCILLWLSFFIACRFSSKRLHTLPHNKLKRYAPMRAVLFSIRIACVLHIIVLSATKVIPFLFQYQNITGKEALDIVYDYGYYIFWHLGVSLLWSVPCMKLLEKVTGRLCFKEFKIDQTKDN